MKGDGRNDDSGNCRTRQRIDQGGDAEHDRSGPKIGGDIHVLVAGSNAQAAADAAAKIAGVGKVLLADAPQLADGLAENVDGTVLNIAKDYSHILAPATAYGKNIAPRIAAHLDVAQISDITAVDSPDTFERPIYAGNAIATCNPATRSRSSRSVRRVSIRWQRKAAVHR